MDGKGSVRDEAIPGGHLYLSGDLKPHAYKSPKYVEGCIAGDYGIGAMECRATADTSEDAELAYAICRTMRMAH